MAEVSGLTGPAGALVKMTFAVMLVDGRAAQQFLPQTAVEYILSGNGSESYSPRFCWFNFRYVTLNVSSLGPSFLPTLQVRSKLVLLLLLLLLLPLLLLTLLRLPLLPADRHGLPRRQRHERRALLQPQVHKDPCCTGTFLK